MFEDNSLSRTICLNKSFQVHPVLFEQFGQPWHDDIPLYLTKEIHISMLLLLIFSSVVMLLTLLSPLWEAVLQPPYGLPLDGMQNSEPTQISSPISSSTPSTQGRQKRACEQSNDNNDNNEGENNGNPKRRRTIYHPDEPHCLPCTLWRQSGGDPNLQHYHPQNNSRHAGSEAVELSQYAHYGSISFHLTSDDCICQPCYKDFKRKHNQENAIPRWAKLRHEHYQVANKHCMYCCDNQCRCNAIHFWGPDEWLDQNTPIHTWKKYLFLTGKVDHPISDDAKHLCRIHYRSVFHLRELRTCSVCNSSDSPCWKLVCDIVSDPNDICDTFRLDAGSIPFSGWICEQCNMCYTDDVHLEDQLTTGSQSHDPITSQRSKLLLSTLEKLKDEGVVFTKDITQQYRMALDSLKVPHTKHNRLCEALIKYLCSLAKQHQYKVFCIPTSKLLGRALYDEQKFNSHSINFIFKLKEEEWKKQKSWVSIEHLTNLIRKQIALFPVSKEFDYTSLISKETTMMELDQYFDSELFDLMNSITTSKNSQKHPSSDLYKDLRKACIWMAIGLLCFAMNPQCCFLQTLTGLLCYAYGLRDKGFEALNALGCCCSIDHIRSHGSYWAGKRLPIQNLDGSKQWRITIDNLNFHIKYAKNLPESASGSSKMLNLLTCQVSHNSIQQQICPSTLKQLVNSTLRRSPPHIISRERNSVIPQDFEIDRNEGYYFKYFLAVCYTCTLNRLPILPTDCTTTFIEAIQSFMPHWTPIKKDCIVYANIDEALSGSIADIEAYLSKVKRDLYIGKPGYPKHITMAGDQQTYALMKELQRKHPDHYNWMTVLHGDWHTLQLLAEMIRDILWDGGFKQLCFECGHKKMPTQWQEIHMLLLALYQSLLHKAMIAYNSNNEATLHGYKKFWDWLAKIASDSNQDQNSKFWARILPFLNGYCTYFIAIRSGNWVLRNSAIKTIAPLFFAYNHYKYEELAATAIVDTLTIPDDILNRYLDGGWTVSVKGRPHHNIALDEAHESLINLRLKTITSRPSHFRTVEMANFMSYLDQVVRGMEELLYRHKQNDPAVTRKRYVCQRVNKMNAMLENVSLFEQHEEERSLCNILCAANKVSLDSKSVLDLMNIATIGRDRMLKYVEEYALLPLTTGPRKRRKRARKLATFSKKSSTITESKKREEELTNIAKNAMQILQANGIAAQTSPYPLAISDLEGNLRDSGKSKFFETLKQCLDFDQAVTNTCQLFTHPAPDLCVILDMLYYVHMPPPVTVLTFEEYFQHLWRQTVGKYAIQKKAYHIYLVFDKPSFLPPPRSIVHKSRRKRVETSIPDPTIKDEADIPHGGVYTSVLAHSTMFKQQFLEYLTLHFKNKATSTTKEYNFQVTIDSPSLTSVITIFNGSITNKTPNEHGEADFAIWYHSIMESSRHIVIVSCDTDTWMYGIGLYTQYLEDKNIFVQRGNTECYIDVRTATSILSQHPKLSHLSFPVLSLLAVYLLTGCDYVSSFYRCSKTCFLETLIRDVRFICPDGNLLRMISDEFQCINEQSWVRLVSAVYYSKFKKFFRSKSVSETFNVIIKHPDSPEAKRMLSAIQHSPPTSGRTNQLLAWHEFIRKVTYHVPRVTKYHEHKLVPSYKALLLHCRRATYVLKLTMSCPWPQSPFLYCFKQFGWHEEDNTILITWDERTQDSDSEEDLDSCSDQSDINSDSSAN